MSKKNIIIFIIIIILQSQLTYQQLQKNIYVDILGTNDIHGAGLQLDKQTGDGVAYKVGGYKLLSGLINILRKDNPKGVLWLDGGDQFQGTLENFKTQGDLMTDFYNTMFLDATTIGNHEWDWGKDRIIKFMNNAKYKYLVSNMKRKSQEEIDQIKSNTKDIKTLEDLDKSLDTLVNDFSKKVSKTQVFEFHDGKIKIGVIGLVTVETYYSTANPPNDYDISDKYNEVITELSNQLKNQQNVDAVIVVSHVGMLCSPKNIDEFQQFKIRTASDEENNSIQCNEKEIPQILSKISQETVNGWVAGHVHDTVHTFQNGIPIVQNPLGGKYANVIRLKFQLQSNGKYQIVSDDTEIQGPIPLCSHVFVSNKICEKVPLNIDMVEYQFRNQNLLSNVDQNVIDLFNSEKYKGVINQVTEMRQNILFSVDNDFLNIKTDFNPLGALLGQALKRNFLSKNQDLDPNKVISILGYGAFRAEFFAGEVSEVDMNTMFPFKGNVVSFKITGDQLLKMIAILQSGRKPFYCFSGINMEVGKNPYQYIQDSAKLENGDQINNDDEFTILTFQFNVLNGGGDDFKTIFNQGIITEDSLQSKVFDLDLNAFLDGFEKKTYYLQDFLDQKNLTIRQSIVQQLIARTK